MIKSFVLHAHNVELTRVGEHVSLPPIVVLHTKIEGNKIQFTFNISPDTNYTDQGNGIPLFVEESDERMVGRPWGYADRKMVFGNLSENPEKLIFWANELELTILPTAECFKELVKYVRS